ncbi:hypothetical protein GCM10007103_05390 [Salinimicrobium marinum]|uniref:Lipoprotein n=1 Tax=Salinimicrobium marinum TaxID=680283 RepID=A0A918S8C0_9FLAO|nr:hypothetical protein [Salinimicrobium marinum]GHA26929.1 hypothetical protein GCM10007103_05390 [Salinimicrobium marinum]
MKVFRTLLIFFLIVSCSTSKNVSHERIFLDEKGTVVTGKEFDHKWINEDDGLARWDYIENKIRYSRLSAPLYERYVLPHDSILRKLENITGNHFNKNTIFLIEYNYLDDLCSSLTPNIWNKYTIKQRKRFLNLQKKSIEANFDNVVVLSFYEEGISLANNPESQKEYFYSDSDQFLRKNLFRNPAMCGSYALVKPNGQALIRNGEHSPEMMTQLLSSENWSLFFSEEAP